MRTPPHHRLRGAAAALLFCLLPRPAHAWGCQGHRIVALIALAHLDPGVAVRVNQLLAASPIPPSRRAACPSDPALPPLAAAANWADEVRTPATEPLHYVDIPLAARPAGFDYARLCAGDCVTSAIARYRQQLHAGAPASRAEALRYLVHLVADVHQPMHAVDDDDRGGNCVLVAFPGAPPRETLHAAWDTGLLQRIMPTPDAAAFAATLDRRYGTRFAGGSQDPVAWAWQSHAIAVADAFDSLPILPGCRHPEQKVTLSPAYLRQATPVIEQQLDRAGFRLATLLNTIVPAVREVGAMRPLPERPPKPARAKEGPLGQVAL